MPRANWGISSNVIDEFDRDSQFQPYTGPKPPSGAVYCFRIAKLWYAAKTQGKNPQLRIDLELTARDDDELRYAGYFMRVFRPIADGNAFTYVPFLDAIGVSAEDFVKRTQVDADDGAITKIGKWRNKGDQYVLGMLVERPDNKGIPRADISWFGPDEDDAPADATADDTYDSAYDADADEIGF